MQYVNREQAGSVLANYLKRYANKANALVLALPRGGVPVAYKISSTLNLPLDVFIVRKIGVPGYKELAMGAVAAGPTTVFNEHIIKEFNVTQEEIERVIQYEMQELKRREITYRNNHTFPSVKGKSIILVDDGMATGATMRVAITALKKLQAKEIIVAIPVASREAVEQIKQFATEVICPLMPEDFHAVGGYYENFPQTEDEEVKYLLTQSRQVKNPHA